MQRRGIKIGGPDEPTLRSTAQRIAEGKCPVPIFNATIVETGQRVVMSPVRGLGVKAEKRPEGWHAVSVSTFRTARRIMDGRIYVPSKYLDGTAFFQAPAEIAPIAR